MSRISLQSLRRKKLSIKGAYGKARRLHCDVPQTVTHRSYLNHSFIHHPSGLTSSAGSSTTAAIDRRPCVRLWRVSIRSGISSNIPYPWFRKLPIIQWISWDTFPTISTWKSRESPWKSPIKWENLLIKLMAKTHRQLCQFWCLKKSVAPSFNTSTEILNSCITCPSDYVNP